VYLALIASFGIFSSLSQNIELANLTPNQGFKIYGSKDNENLGNSVKSIGDVNGDEKPDIIIGAPFPIVDLPRGVVIYGGQSSYPEIIDLASPPAGYGFQILAQEFETTTGSKVDNSGDINGDGIADMVLGGQFGKPSSDRTNAGVAFIVFGKEGGFSDNIQTSSLDGENGFKVLGANAQEFLGISISNGGDINGDGFDDVVIGSNAASANGKGGAGIAYVLYGRPAGFPSIIDTRTFDNSLGFRVLGANEGDNLGITVNIGGDINGDQIDDLVIAAPYYDANGFADNGAVFVIYGNTATQSSDIDLANLQSSQGFKIIGGGNEDNLGASSISSIGDINGDGIDDIIIGALGVSSNTLQYSGAYYVIYGRSTGFPETIDVNALPPEQGFKIITSDEYEYSFGYAVSSNGDVNGDGINDIIISGTGGRGNVYILYGSTNGFNSVVDVNSLTILQGFKIIGAAEGDNTGVSVSSGDINGDVFDDIVIGAGSASPLGRPGVGITYVISGRPICGEGYINWDITCVDECNAPYIPTTERNQKYCNYPCRSNQYLTWLGKCSCFCRGGVEEIVNGYKFCNEGSSLEL